VHTLNLEVRLARVLKQGDMKMSSSGFAGSQCFQRLVFVVLFSVLSQPIAFAAVIAVPGNYPTIQAAINAATDGDEIIVLPGAYYENINFNGKNIVLRSTDPTNLSVVGGTTIDGNHAGSVVTFSGSELTTCVLSGFTIRNGYAGTGGGVCGNGTLATIQYNNITDNSVYLKWAYPPDDCGGGLYRCNGIIQNNIIHGNFAGYDGGGLFACIGGVIQNNTIYDNFAGFQGPGLCLCDNIRNCIVWGNQPTYNPQVALCPTPSYSCIENWTWGGVGNISSDPRFVDPSHGDFHLLVISPCIDAGGTVTLAQDFEGDPRPHSAVSWETRGDGSHFDIGADEFIGKVPPTAVKPQLWSLYAE
jgi:hypothetical protein